MKKICILLLGTVLCLFTGCTTTTQSQYCINIEEDVECPTIEEANATTFPAEDCGGTHTQATAFSSRNDSISIWEEDTALDNQYDGCCYTTSYVAPIVADCIE